jgi:hypothetical protein
VDIPNAFIGKVKQPTAQEIALALGPAIEVWDEFLAWLAEQGVSTQEWKSYSTKSGWSLQVKLKKRTIVHLSVCAGCFRVGCILGDRAVRAALQRKLPNTVMEAIKKAPRYAEGTGVRLIVRKRQDLAGIQKLASVKLAN